MCKTDETRSQSPFADFERLGASHAGLAPAEQHRRLQYAPLPLDSAQFHQLIQFRSVASCIVVVGGLLGTQRGREVEIMNSFELVIDAETNQVDFEYFVTRKDQCQSLVSLYRNSAHDFVKFSQASFPLVRFPRLVFRRTGSRCTRSLYPSAGASSCISCTIPTRLTTTAPVFRVQRIAALPPTLRLHSLLRRTLSRTARQDLRNDRGLVYEAGW